MNVGNTPEDRRFLLSSGPVSLPAGGELELDFAYIFTRNSLNPNGLTISVARNVADVQRVHERLARGGQFGKIVLQTGEAPAVPSERDGT